MRRMLRISKQKYTKESTLNKAVDARIGLQWYRLNLEKLEIVKTTVVM